MQVTSKKALICARFDIAPHRDTFEHISAVLTENFLYIWH